MLRHTTASPGHRAVRPWSWLARPSAANLTRPKSTNAYARRLPNSVYGTRRQNSRPRPECRAGNSIGALWRSATGRNETGAADSDASAAAGATPWAVRRMAVPVAFAAAGLAHPRPRLALPLGRDRHPGTARPRARDY